MRQFFPASLLVSSAVLLSATNSGAGIVISGLHNTGVDNQSGGALAAGAKELNFSLTGPANQAYVELVVYHFGNPNAQAWVTPPNGSAWIGPNVIPNTYPNDPIGDYHYTLTFTLNGATDLSKLQIVGSWATDNEAQWWLNGSYTAFSKSAFGFTQLDAFGVQGGLVNGLNTLEFWVKNSGGPSGLLVANLRIASDGSLSLPSAPPITPHNEPWRSPETTPVPEPSTVMGGALLLLPLVLRSLKCSRGSKVMKW